MNNGSFHWNFRVVKVLIWNTEHLKSDGDRSTTLMINPLAPSHLTDNPYPTGFVLNRCPIGTSTVSPNEFLATADRLVCQNAIHQH